MADQKYRLVTRSDFDGVVCGALLLERELISSVEFADPADMQHGRVDVDKDCITTNLPYSPDVYLCFDHHWSELERVGSHANFIIDPNAPSAARVVYDYYGGEVGFPNISPELMNAVDKADSAQFTETEVLAPEGWTLLNFILDGRTGLNQLKDFAISNEQLMLDLMTYCRHNPVEEILALPDLQERVASYSYHKEFAERQLTDCSKMVGHTVVCDMRNEDHIYAVDRFLIYAIFPKSNLSITLKKYSEPGITEISCGKSIFLRTSKVNIGSLMLQHGGGGHAAAGTCRVPDDQVEATLNAILASVAEEAA